MHEAFPQAQIFVRVFDRRAVVRLRGGAATGVYRELLESAMRMAREAMAAVGVDDGEIERTEALYRQRDRERLKIQFESRNEEREVIFDRLVASGQGWMQGRGAPPPPSPTPPDPDEVPERKITETDCG